MNIMNSKIEIERDESNGRDDHHYSYRVLFDGLPISQWVSWSRANEIADEQRKLTITTEDQNK